MFVFVAIVIIVTVVYGLLVVLARATGGTLQGGLNRFIQLGLWALTTAQVHPYVADILGSIRKRNIYSMQVVSQASSVQSSSMPSFVKSAYRAVSALQFSGILLPPACTGA